jgi:hypothetical protein
MSSEEDKAFIELKVFKEFIEKTQLPIRPESIKKPGGKSDPDIFCTFQNGEDVAFELVEICASDLAIHISKLKEEVLRTSDPTEEIILNKLTKSKTYKTQLPIELLCYTNARVVSPDDLIIAVARRCADSTESRFRKIWLLGEKGVYEVWKAH